VRGNRPARRRRELTSSRRSAYAGGMEEKLVLLHGFEPGEVVAAMRAIKAALPSARDAAFATTTETNLLWRVSELIEHVSEEHRAIKASRERKA